MFRRTGYRFAVKNMRHSTNSATAAEAAGAAVSQVFLAVRAGGRRNGRGRGKGQSKGQNELRHCHLLWVLVSFGGGPHARPPVSRCRASPAFERVRPAHGRMFSGRRGDGLEADVGLLWNLL